MNGAGFAERGPGHWVVVTTSYPTHAEDPSGHFVASEVRALRARGHRVTVLAPRVEGARVERETDVRWLPAGRAFGWPGALARVKQRPWRALGVLRFVHAARRELRRYDDVERIVAHFAVPCAWPIGTHATRELEQLGVRGPRPALEVVAHGSDVRLLARLPRWLRRKVARSLAGAEIRCASHELAGTLERALGPAIAENLRVAAPALELGQRRSRAEARRELGVAAGARLVVVVGRLVSSKRVAVALRAAALVPGALVVVVGDGPERAHIERAFPGVRCVGRVARSSALAWLVAADVLLSASELEGAPSVVREARALGTRVVASAAGDLIAWSQADTGLCVLASPP